MELLELRDTLTSSTSEKVIFTTSRFGTFEIEIVDTHCETFIELNALLKDDNDGKAISRATLIEELNKALGTFPPETPVALWYEDDRDYIGQVKDYNGMLVIEHRVHKKA